MLNQALKRKEFLNATALILFFTLQREKVTIPIAHEVCPLTEGVFGEVNLGDNNVQELAVKDEKHVQWTIGFQIYLKKS